MLYIQCSQWYMYVCECAKLQCSSTAHIGHFKCVSKLQCANICTLHLNPKQNTLQMQKTNRLHASGSLTKRTFKLYLTDVSRYFLNNTIFVRNVGLQVPTRSISELKEKWRKKKPPNYIYCGKGLGAQFQSQVVCLTSGERRVQLLVEEPLLPVLLLLSDIAPWWLNVAQHGADSATGSCRRTQ